MRIVGTFKKRMHELTYSDIINESIKEPLLAYKYSGQDDSILYKHVISPLCQWIVEKKTPTWLAPNTITVVGMLINLFPHLLIFLTVEDEKTPPHRVLMFMQGAGMILYSIADNMDGKQARKIGASSPLGMIIDHGCDGISGGLIGLSVAKIMMLEHFWQAFTILSTIFLFFLANLTPRRFLFKSMLRLLAINHDSASRLSHHGQGSAQRHDIARSLAHCDELVHGQPELEFKQEI